MLQLHSHADTCVIGNNCLIIYDHNKKVNVYIHNPKDDHRSAKTVDTTVAYHDPHTG